jgi:AcrR family transcriptional regulator
MPRPNRRAEILRAAGEEFREHGYENATLEGIGARVGILKGSIYTYVSSKEELLYAVVEEPARRLLADLRHLREQRRVGVPVVACLRELFRMQVAIFSAHYPAAFVYLRLIGQSPHPVTAPPAPDPSPPGSAPSGSAPSVPVQRAEFAAMDREYVAAVEGLLADGVAAGELSLPTSPGVAARALIGMLDWMQHWFTPRGAAADRALADDLFALALGGLMAGASARAVLDSALPPAVAAPQVPAPPEGDGAGDRVPPATGSPTVGA